MDMDFAAASDWAQQYRQLGWTVVPALTPGEGKQGQWKRPAVAWREHQHGVADDVWQQWYGPQGQFLTRPNIGILTGKGIFVLDLDLYKPDASRWWQQVLAVHNNGMELETVSQRTGGGGRQLLFAVPAGWTPPTNRTPIGIDIRGVGGFAMLPPSRHESGRNYEWEEGRDPTEAAVLEAPQWLCAEIDALVGEAGRQAPDGTPTQKTTSPHVALSAIAHVAQDGREEVMTRHVWGCVVNLFRDAPFPPIGAALDEEIVKGFRSYARKVKSRLVEPGTPTEDLLEREGRGITAYRDKFHKAMALWNTRVAEHAKLPPPVREPARPLLQETGERIDPETGEVLSAAENRQELNRRAAAINGGGDFSSGAEAEAEDDDDDFDIPPFRWPSETEIPQRKFLYGEHYIRKFVSTDIAAGGVGKSSLVMAEALAMASGRPLLGKQPADKLTAVYWNGEDPLEEIERRSVAIAKQYIVDVGQAGERYRIASGRDMPIVLVSEDRDGLKIATPLVNKLIRFLKRRKVDVLIIDPFVSSHRVKENDNNAIERVVKQWAQIADACDCSVNLVHHARKTNGTEVTVEDGRGAVALLAAARSARSLNQMTEDEAAKHGIKNRRLYFRVDNGKANLAPPADAAEWYKLHNVTLRNGPYSSDGDQVGVVTTWEVPDAMAGMTPDHLKIVQNVVASGEWRKDTQSPNWVGFAVSKALNLNVSDPQDKARIKHLLKTWLESGALEVVSKPDSSRRDRLFVVVGRWVGETD